MVSEFLWVPVNSYGTFSQATPKILINYYVLFICYLNSVGCSLQSHSFPMIAMVTLRILNPALPETLHHNNLRGVLSTRTYMEESHGFPINPMVACQIPIVFFW